MRPDKSGSVLNHLLMTSDPVTVPAERLSVATLVTEAGVNRESDVTCKIQYNHQLAYVMYIDYRIYVRMKEFLWIDGFG